MRKKLQTELKRQHQACNSCVSLKEKLKKCQDEMDETQETYYDQKTRHNEVYHKFRNKLNEMR